MATKPKSEQMCVFKIGYRDYLMPAAAGMKVVQLLTQAVECEEHYEGDLEFVYVAGDQVNVSYRNVRSGQIHMPDGQVIPKSRRLTKQPLPLGFERE
ncbi:hypothetical protein [Dyella terrae]|uniref:hypothetical protein n=1 Tax=Dyella terrae TaxID=522259 RepID=UPI001EFE17C4|nr:hypothetical protein [Dyella terrae]ULU26615.1 hypothetical protein DYST_03561 [Dyella terrae]